MTTNPISGWRRFTSRLKPATKYDVMLLEAKIMAKITEVSDRLVAAEAKVSKIEGEVTKLKADFEILKENTGDGDFPAAGTAALERIEATFQRIDDINADTAPPTDPGTPV